MDVRSFFRGGRKPRAVIIKRAAKKAPAKAVPKKARKAMAQIATRVFNRKVETNYIAENQEPIAIYGDTLPGGGSAQLYTCVPDVSQGDESLMRNGNKISPVKHRTDLQFVFNDDPQINVGGTATPASTAGWDITVHVWYGFAKRYKSVTDVAAGATSILAQMLDVGNGAQSRFTGLMSDELFVVNKDFLNLRYKKTRLYKNAGRANVLDTTSPSLGTPFHQGTRMSLSWKPPKVLSYKDETSTIPENYAPFIIVGYSHNDGTQASDVANTGPTTVITAVSAVKMIRSDKLWFKDA